MDALVRDEVDRLVTMGLGRGVKATDPKPFHNKSSFQVRQATFDNIIGTEECGVRKHYDVKVSSSFNIQTSMKASTATLVPVTLGVDAELSRGTKQNRKLTGEKVLNRTVAFKDDFKEKRTLAAEPGEVWEPGSDSTFEERLSHWILEQMQVKGIPVPETRGNPIEILTTTITDSSGEELQKIIDILEKECLSFVYQHHITHYVSKLELGASVYKLAKEYDYEFKTKAGTKVGDVVEIGGDLEQKKHRRTSRQLQIGVIGEKGIVQRRSKDEAVIGVQVHPITQLVNFPPLHRALKRAVVIFIEDNEDKSAGPFIITCNFDRLLLRVNENHEVVCTDDPSKASRFFITTTNDHDDQFSIAYDVKSPQRNVMPTTCYLSAPANLSGHNPGPLQMTECPTSKDLSMTIESRLNNSPSDFENWVSGEDVFFIHCARRFIFSDAYICVKQYKPFRETASVVRHTVSLPGDEPAGAARNEIELQELPQDKATPTPAEQPETNPPAPVEQPETILLIPAEQPEITPPTPAEQPEITPPTPAVQSETTPPDPPTYITACVPSKSYHNKTDTFMLFHLIRANVLQPDVKTQSSTDAQALHKHDDGHDDPPL